MRGPGPARVLDPGVFGRSQDVYGDRRIQTSFASRVAGSSKQGQARDRVTARLTGRERAAFYRTATPRCRAPPTAPRTAAESLVRGFVKAALKHRRQACEGRKSRNARDVVNASRLGQTSAMLSENQPMTSESTHCQASRIFLRSFDYAR